MVQAEGVRVSSNVKEASLCLATASPHVPCVPRSKNFLGAAGPCGRMPSCRAKSGEGLQDVKAADMPAIPADDEFSSAVSLRRESRSQGGEKLSPESGAKGVAQDRIVGAAAGAGGRT